MKPAPFIPLTFTEYSPEDMLLRSRQFYQLIKQRRTVRDFSDRPVAREIIDNAILSAGSAPSGANKQPWHFVVVSNETVKKEIRLAAEAEEKAFYQHRAPEEWLHALAPLGTDEHKPFLETAPYLIAVFLKKFTYHEAQKQKNYYTAESVGIACGMLITALHYSGLATLTHTPSPMKFLNTILQRPSDERPYLLLVTGYPSEHAEVPNIQKGCGSFLTTQKH
ncbi:nitroreductase family protein [Zooshikella ganghwensis]|uniref:Nitroreductase family protein n=1 Tax=Zooshikella ganghwensis TaxID=202772 RepID=A0A4P9VHV9_9GAMM|nr:nitroreductase family protein [Zooshikella ganghwensis]RDH42778.1 nitroreductase family protein [Zooshikella ganghwensis]